MTTTIIENYVVRLRVVDTDGTPLSGLAVAALDHDRGREPDKLANGVTDADGTASLSFSRRAAGGASEGNPELFVMVHSRDGTLVHQSKPLELKVANHDLRLVAHPRTVAGAGGAAPSPATNASPNTGDAPRPGDPASVPGTNRFHGSAKRNAMAPRSPFYHGPFGRLFRQLPAWVPPGADEAAKVAKIEAIAARMVEPDGQPDAPAGDNPAIPAGYTYFGQFVDHDVTFDPSSSLSKLNDPDRLINFRTPRFDLDSLYGEGPDDEPFMYDQRAGREGEFLIGKLPFSDERDLPRNEQGTALLGDPRNDENTIVGQLQLSFLRLHNVLLRRVKNEEALQNREAFTRAQLLLRWHYQWVVLFDYLPRICGPEVVNRILLPKKDGAGFQVDLKLYKFRDAPFMPVEFSAAAYRFGHSQIRHRYDLNGTVRGVPIFLPPAENPGPNADLRGFRRLPPMWTIDWSRFLAVDPSTTPQSTRLIDTRLSRALSSIPAGPDPAKGSPLAALNLLRGFRLGLPSGQAVARAIGEDVLDAERLELPTELAGSEAPLWYYILKEAQLTQGGRSLGAVGGRIVAETLIGIAKADPSCFLNVDPAWTPSRAFANGVQLDPLSKPLELAGMLRGAAGEDSFRQR